MSQADSRLARNVIRFVPALLATVLLFGCVDREAQEQARRTEEFLSDPVIPVVAEQVFATSVPDEVEISGAMVTLETVAVSPVVPGLLTSVNVREGQSVRAGQIIAVQDSRDLQIQLRQAQTNLEAARSQLAQAQREASASPDRTRASIRSAEARLEQARQQLARAETGARSEEIRQAEIALSRAESDLRLATSARDRAQRLYDEGAIALAQLEQAQNAYEGAVTAVQNAQAALEIALAVSRVEDIEIARQEVRAAEEALRLARVNEVGDAIARDQVEVARSNLRAAQLQVELARKAVEDTRIKAPVSGRVTGTPARSGSYGNPGVPIAQIVGEGTLYFEAEVPEAQILAIEMGAEVDVKLTALSDFSLRGRVVSIDPLATSVGRLFTVRVGFDAVPERVRPGMFARGSLVVDALQEAYLVPSSAVYRDDGVGYVFVVDNGSARRADVRILRTVGSSTVVDGLSDGDLVIVDGGINVVDGTPVRVTDADSIEGSES